MNKSTAPVATIAVISAAALAALGPNNPVSIIPHALAEGLTANSEAQCPRGEHDPQYLAWKPIAGLVNPYRYPLPSLERRSR